MTCFNSKATPTNDTDCSYHKGCRTYLANHMGLISCHIMPLVIYSLGGIRTCTKTHAHTHTHTHTYTHTHTQTYIPTSHTESILRNQACAGRTHLF